MTEYVVYVDKNGKPNGEVAPKLQAHNAHTKLHLAFSCYVFNERGELLVTQRAKRKKVWPGVWTNTVCGHPMPDETMEDAIRRRLDYELGMTATDFKLLLPTYTYKTPLFKNIIEHEFCPVYVATATSDPQPNLSEVENYEWMTWDAFTQRALNDTGNVWSWWCKDQIKQLGTNPNA